MKIVLKETAFENLTLEEQEYFWVLSRTNEVYIEDINGEMFQVLDGTEEE